MTPRTRYARSGDVSIAYQVLGDGPADLVMVFGYVSSIELIWEEPMLARFLTRLSSDARLIVFDKRGTGLSDRVSQIPSLEVRMDDVRHARHMAERIGSAKLVELPGADHVPWLADADIALAEIGEFLTGVRSVAEPDRLLATVLFTDMVKSTEKAALLGDRRWHDLLDRHNVLVRQEIARWRGREVSTQGDGFLALFDGPARGVRCARAIIDSVRPLGIDLRCGLHSGECETMGNNVGGIAVHIGARVAALAEAGEVLVSSTVKDLVAGSGLRFSSVGVRELRGVPGEWRIFRADQRSPRAMSAWSQRAASVNGLIAFGRERL